ncbi:hypothetical protein BKH41_01930 [Helicobacter sp. 12S02232-10]|uniref:hypothetical protein n=1 Tax=Helicobacter sp. 12S02232-10 TaxID=1476197 RepID=UPI000BA78980|nr:hypothetical protein [Helicobacter sp. 12S02232-10]PAF49447.1 hypothetical protein BKH41_01930 [Helicobacter sp. 12S02232-10]
MKKQKLIKLMQIQNIYQIRSCQQIIRKILLLTGLFSAVFILSACSDKYYEMYKSPCACFEDIKKLNGISKSNKFNTIAPKFKGVSYFSSDKRENYALDTKERSL